MKILIVGGAGFIGRELCRQLSSQHSVGVLDCFRYGRKHLGEQGWRAHELFAVDVTDRETTTRVFDDFQPDVVIHLAAIHYIPECEGDPSAAVATNVGGTVNVMLACPRGSRVVLASSGAVYAPDVHPHVEGDSPVGPSDVYGLSKLHAEQYVGYFAEKRQLAAVVVRLFNVVGPGETNPHVVPDMVAQVRAGRREIGLGNLWPRRSYLHVKDAAAGFAAAALQGEVAPGGSVTVNLGTPQAHSVSNIAEKLARVSGRQFALRQDLSRVRSVDRPVLAADHTKMTALFGWTPRHGLDEALADIWRDPGLVDGLAKRWCG